MSDGALTGEEECTISEFQGSKGVGRNGVYLNGKPTVCADETGNKKCFQLETDGTWQQSATILSFNRPSVVAITSDVILVSGGQNSAGAPWKSTRYVTSDGTEMSGPDLPVRTVGHCLAATEDMLFITGGFNEFTFTTYRHLWKYDITSEVGQWLANGVQGADMKTGRFTHGCIVDPVDLNLYVAGGFDNPESGPLDTLEIYQSSTDQWIGKFAL